jgi:hypothetical protein
VDFNSLMTGLESKVVGRLPDATWVYPGTEPILRSARSWVPWIPQSVLVQVVGLARGGVEASVCRRSCNSALARIS